MHFIHLRVNIVLLLLALMMGAPGRAHGGTTGDTGFAPDQTTAAVLVGTKGNATVTGLDINASTLLMNGGINCEIVEQDGQRWIVEI